MDKTIVIESYHYRQCAMQNLTCVAQKRGLKLRLLNGWKHDKKNGSWTCQNDDFLTIHKQISPQCHLSDHIYSAIYSSHVIQLLNF